MNTKPPILLAAFGSASPAGQAVYEHIAAWFGRRLAGHELAWGFTSGLVRRCWAERGRTVASPAEVLAAWRARGVPAAVVQSLHISPGEEFAPLTRLAVPGLRLALGRPLLDTPADVAAVAALVAAAFRPDAVNVVVGHGNAKRPEYNRSLLALAARLAAAHPDVVFATLEGEPGTAPLAAARATAARRGAAHFIPLLLVPGRHVEHDVLGRHADAWRQLLGAPPCTCAPPLGMNERALDLFARHSEVALAQLTGAGDG